MKPLLTVDEAAGLLKITPGGLRQMVFRGAVPYAKVGRCVRFSEEELLAWLKSRTRGVEEQKSEA